MSADPPESSCSKCIKLDKQKAEQKAKRQAKKKEEEQQEAKDPVCAGQGRIQKIVKLTETKIKALVKLRGICPVEVDNALKHLQGLTHG